MKIGEVVQKTGFSRDTIRFYEKIDLIKLNPHDRYPNNYKKYSSEIVRRLLNVRELKEFGFTLNEIKTILGKWETETLDCDKGKFKIQERILEIENEIEKLKEKKRRLEKSIHECPQNCAIESALNAEHS